MSDREPGIIRGLELLKLTRRRWTHRHSWRTASSGGCMLRPQSLLRVVLIPFAFTGRAGVFQVVDVNAPTGRVGGSLPTSRTFRIEAAANANRISLAVMLICTNDGFTGLDGVALPGGFKPLTYYTAGYDAGTEANDELSTIIVDACFAIGPTTRPPDGNARTPTIGVIEHHPGIQGVGDLDP